MSVYTRLNYPDPCALFPLTLSTDQEKKTLSKVGIDPNTM